MSLENKTAKQKLKIGTEYDARPYFFLFEEYWKPKYGKKAKINKKDLEESQTKKTFSYKRHFLQLFFWTAWLLAILVFITLTLVISGSLDISGWNVIVSSEAWNLTLDQQVEIMNKIGKIVGDKTSFLTVFQIMLECDKSIMDFLVLPLLFSISVGFLTSYSSFFVYVMCGYYRFWRKNWWKEEYKALTRAKNIATDIKKTTALMTYRDYLEDSSTTTILLDTNYYDMLNPKQGHPGYGFSLSTFVLTTQEDIDFVLKHNKVPKHIWETTITPFTTQNEASNVWGKFVNSQRINPDDKNSKFKMSYAYGVILSWGVHSLVEGATGSGKGQTSVLPEVFANLASVERPSIVLTFKAEFLKEYDFFAKIRGYEHWKIRLDDTPNSDSFNPIYLGYFFNLLYRQLQYGTPELITSYTPWDLENSFTVRFKRGNSPQYEERNTLLNRKEVLIAIATFEKNNNIFNYEPLKGWANKNAQGFYELLEADFITILKSYNTTIITNEEGQLVKNRYGIKISNVYKPLLFYPQGTLDIWNKKTNGKSKKQTIKRWYRVGNFVYEFLSEHGGNNLKVRKNWCIQYQKTYSTEMVEMIHSLQVNKETSVWTAWGLQLSTFFFSLFLEATEFSPMLTEEYFNLPSLLSWINSLKHASDPKDNEYSVLYKNLIETNLKESWKSFEATKSVYETPDDQWGSIISMTTDLTSTFTSGDLLPIVLRNDFNLLALSLKPTFCSLTMAKTDSLNKIMSILVKNITDSSALILGETSDRKLPVKTLFQLDEAGSGPPLPAQSLKYVSSLGRSSGCFMNLAFQDLAQINDQRYPKEAESLKRELMQNALLKKIIGVTTFQNSDFWSKELGNYKSITEGITIKENAGAEEFNFSSKIEEKVSGQNVVELPIFSSTEIKEKLKHQIIGKYTNFNPFLLAAPPFWASPFLSQIQSLAKNDFQEPPKVAVISAENWQNDWYIDLVQELNNLVSVKNNGIVTFDFEDSIFGSINENIKHLSLKDIFDGQKWVDLHLNSQVDTNGTPLKQSDVELNFFYNDLSVEGEMYDSYSSPNDDSDLEQMVAKLHYVTIDDINFPSMSEVLNFKNDKTPPTSVLIQQERELTYLKFNVNDDLMDVLLNDDDYPRTFKDTQNKVAREKNILIQQQNLKKQQKQNTKAVDEVV